VPITLAPANLRWAEGLLRAGDIPKARGAAERALEVSRASSARGIEADALHILGGVAAGVDPLDTDVAVTFYERSTALAEELGMRRLLAHCHLDLGSLCRRVGKRHEAHNHHATATTMFRQMDMRFWLPQAEAELKG